VSGFLAAVLSWISITVFGNGYRCVSGVGCGFSRACLAAKGAQPGACLVVFEVRVWSFSAGFRQFDQVCVWLFAPGCLRLKSVPSSIVFATPPPGGRGLIGQPTSHKSFAHKRTSHRHTVTCCFRSSRHCFLSHASPSHALRSRPRIDGPRTATLFRVKKLSNLPRPKHFRRATPSPSSPRRARVARRCTPARRWVDRATVNCLRFAL
jgi:hypothetical protein